MSVYRYNPKKTSAASAASAASAFQGFAFWFSFDAKKPGPPL